MEFSRTRLAMNGRATKRIGVALVAVVAVLLASSGEALAHGPAGLGHRATYQLALGDSFPYGFTTAKARAGLPPEAFSGFVDLLDARLRARRPRLRTVNFSCPGESTTTFAAGPCDWTAAGFALHDGYSGTQLAAAERFLRAHRGRHALVTLTLWGNDMRLFLASCPDVACLAQRAPAEIAAFGVRLHAVLSRLRAADPAARIVVVGAFHVRLDIIEFGDQLIASFNATMHATAAQARARFANPAPVFNPPGDLAARTAALCSLTLLCSENDSHPGPAGHLALTELIWQAAA